MSSKNKKDKQVKIKFEKKNKDWILKINRTKEKGYILQTYFCSHPYLQLVLNKHLPKEIWKEHELSNKKTYTRNINVEFNLEEWRDIRLEPHDFLIEIEKFAKKLMKESLKYGFSVNFVPKGREYDLELISPKGKTFILSISSYNAKDIKRNKEQRRRKILTDISKVLPTLYQRKAYPIIVSQPLEFKGSWSFTTDNYLNFYKEKFNFKFITTNFKKGWERDITNKFLEIDKNVQL